MHKLSKRFGGNLKIEQLNLSPDEKEVTRIITKFISRKTIFANEMTGGLSKAKKILVKPDGLCAFVLKLDNVSAIRRELRGDKLLRYRIAAQSMPVIEAHEEFGITGALLYRYVTEPNTSFGSNRLDLDLHKLSGSKYFCFMRVLFDEILSKAHWAGKNISKSPAIIPKLPDPEDVAQTHWLEVSQKQLELSDLAYSIAAPHGFIHGDLHAQNVLFTETQTPVLVDFEQAREDGCIFEDYVKLELSLMFMAPAYLRKEFESSRAQVYGAESILIPRSLEVISGAIYSIRSICIKNCLSPLVGMTIVEAEFIYRAWICTYLARMSFKKRISASMRTACLSMFKEVHRGAVTLIKDGMR